MMALGAILLSIGVIGFLYTLIGSMIISIIFGKSKKKQKHSGPITFEILLAAYNEERTILHSLESFKKVAEVLNSRDSGITLSVFVGLDHCTDKTLDHVLSFSHNPTMKVSHFENSGPRGKWFIVKQLIEKSNADWVALTDCGSIWHEELLDKVSHLLGTEDLFCISPSYLPSNAKFLETMYWRMEQFIRTNENIGGGTIMVHGPTVFYRRSALLRAIELLGLTHWFNDDVVIPMILRLDNPKNHVHYFASSEQVAWVRDIGVVSDVNIELRRRKRILIGNLQIIKNLILPRFNFFNLASWGGLRLAFKAMWAYWITFFGAGALLIILSLPEVSSILFNQSALSITLEVLALFLLVVVLFKKSNYLQRLFMAYLSGLWIYKGWKALDTPEKISWS
jgi:glycosyltransferase involved in cell wall biosynthesis